MGQQSSPLSPSFNGRVVKDDKNDRFYVTDSNNVPVALLGKDSAGNIVVKVAMSGQNVISAPDNELIFNSQQDTFKIVDKLSTTFTVTSTTSAVGYGTATITHNLGYVPLTLSTVTITQDWNGGTGIFPVPYLNPATNTGVDSGQLFVIVSFVRVQSVTSSAITFYIGELAGGSTIAGTITTYFLQETAS